MFRAIILIMLCAAGVVRAESPFAIRGIKGLWWEGLDKYRLALPWVAEHRMNFLMLCYSSFAASGKDWRGEYTAEELAGFGELNREAEKLGVKLCLSFNPGIWSKPPLVYSSEADYQKAWAKVKTVHALGINYFSLCLDDIGRELVAADRERFGDLAAAQVHLVNRLWADMKTLSPKPTLIFCPSAYTTADAKQHLDYIKKIGEIDSGVLMFWTGPTVCSATITAADAREFGAWISRKPVVWDNYPVNDMFPWRPLLAPVKGRSADLASATSGFMANPMKQWHISRLPLATLAEYLNDPAGYEPYPAMERAIASLDAGEQPAARLLVWLYGSSFLGEKDYPPEPRVKSAEEAQKVLMRYRQLEEKLNAAGAAALKADVQETLEADVRLLSRKARDRKTASPLTALGDDFEGGGAGRFGFQKHGRFVNYVYAAPTKHDEMHTSFWWATPPKNGAKLLIVGRNDDGAGKATIALSINGKEIYRGASPCAANDFSTHEFDVPAEAMIEGENVLSFRNVEAEGKLGMPPWVMVAEATLAPK